MAIMKGGSYVEGAPYNSKNLVKGKVSTRSYPRLLVTVPCKKRYRGQGK